MKKYWIRVLIASMGTGIVATGASEWVLKPHHLFWLFVDAAGGFIIGVCIRASRKADWS